MQQFCLDFLISFLATYFYAPLFKGLAFRFKILDIPGGRKIHKVATPLLGGAAILLGLITALIFDLKTLTFSFSLLLGATIIFSLGLINDIKPLSAQFRLLCQVLIALIIISLGLRIEFLPNNLWGNFSEIVLTIVWIVGVTNAYNYLDGLDGLAAGSAVVNLLCFTVILYRTGQYALGMISVILLAACLGFLPHNFKKAKIFLGDAGSTLIGFMLAAIAVMGNWAEDNIVKISIPILILGVPIFDIIFTTVVRVKDEKVTTLLEWLQYGGKDHFHHYLVDLGFQPQGAVLFIYSLTLSLGIGAIMVSNDRAWEALLTLTQATVIFGIIATLIIVGKRRRSGWK